jgi:hypothetical protein
MVLFGGILFLARQSSRKLTIVTKQVVAVKGSYAYVASYVRPESEPSRPEANRWVHGFCLRAD